MHYMSYVRALCQGLCRNEDRQGRAKVPRQTEERVAYAEAKEEEITRPGFKRRAKDAGKNSSRVSEESGAAMGDAAIDRADNDA
ncbi:hypothetical protein ANO11243_087280 [Dothideomycetidae sp. 11243]|nr:hypothetical protein ANO11243_087280 [fungal sp. No.11243]